MQKSNKNDNQHQQKGNSSSISSSSSGDDEVHNNIAIENSSPNKGDSIERGQNNNDKIGTSSSSSPLFPTSESTDAAVTKHKKPRKTVEERKEAKRAANRRSAYKCRLRSTGTIEQLRRQISDAYKRTEEMRKDNIKLRARLNDIENENGILSQQLQMRKVHQQYNQQ